MQYEIRLTSASPSGGRVHRYDGDDWAMDRLENGVIVMMSTDRKSLVEYSPYAWQSVRTDNINLEDMND